jgi:hypothetical protein
MAVFDANHWYQINLQGLFDNRSMVGQPPQSPGTTGNVIFKLTDNTSKGRFWQLYPVDDTRYILRSQSSSPDTYLAIQNDANTAKGSIATMRNVSGAHDEIFWKITEFKNGGYMLSNVANGTDWHLHAENANTVSMTNNITGEQDNQKFSFSTSRSIDDVTFSSVQVQHLPCCVCVRVLMSAVAFGGVYNFSIHAIKQAFEWASPRNENCHWCVRQRGRVCPRCGHGWYVLHPPKTAQEAIEFSKFDAI